MGAEFDRHTRRGLDDPTVNDATKRGEWVTNLGGSEDAHWPRRDARYKEGPPAAYGDRSQSDLAARGIRGLYLDEDIPEGIKSRPIIARPGGPPIDRKPLVAYSPPPPQIQTNESMTKNIVLLTALAGYPGFTAGTVTEAEIEGNSAVVTANKHRVRLTADQWRDATPGESENHNAAPKEEAEAAPSKDAEPELGAADDSRSTPDDPEVSDEDEVPTWDEEAKLFVYADGSIDEGQSDKARAERGLPTIQEEWDALPEETKSDLSLTGEESDEELLAKGFRLADGEWTYVGRPKAELPDGGETEEPPAVDGQIGDVEEPEQAGEPTRQDGETEGLASRGDEQTEAEPPKDDTSEPDVGNGDLPETDGGATREGQDITDGFEDVDADNARND